MAFVIREARAADVDQIAPWTTDTFSWGDYVGSSLSDWIGDPRLHVLVVEDGDGVAVAVARAQLLSPTEGWLDAARVNPEVRRKGLGTLLNDACVEWVRGQGGRVARLAIEADNTAAHNQVLKLGYRATSTWVTYDHPVDPRARVKRDERLQTVGRADVDPAWMFWSTSDMAETGRGLMSFGWLWRRATVDDLTKAASEQRFLESPAGWVVIETPDPDEIDVVWLATSANEFPRLIDALLDLGADRSAETIVFRVPQTGWSGEALTRAGGIVRETQVYEKPLS